jgi:NAD(P)-dependent dehydrogenase (short-subunit alcohol dehydrogenase family)
MVTQETTKRLIAKNMGGSIINIASILGERVMPGVLTYTVTKAGVVQLTKALALEWARHNIRINAIAPGYVETDINRGLLQSETGKKIIQRIPQRRTGNLEDLDGPLLLLASDASAFMTGAIVPVDGGHLVSSL